MQEPFKPERPLRQSDEGELGELWAIFERTRIPASAGKAQRRDMRAAFYAGCAGGVEILTGASAEETQHVLNTLRLEMSVYWEGVRNEMQRP